MKVDLANPSIIFAKFNKPHDKREIKFYKDGEKLGLRFRKVEFIDVQVPIDDRYNDAVNFLKQNTTPILRQFLELEKLNIPFINLPKMMKEKLNLEPFNYKEFDKNFKPSNYYPYGYLGLTPFLVDTKYEKVKDIFDEKEKINYWSLKSLSSDNYKPLKTPTAKEEYFKK